MQAFVLESDLVALKRLGRGDAVAVYTPNEHEGRRVYPIRGPYWYRKGVVQHHHHDGTLTIRFHDVSGRLPQTLRFDTTFHAVRSTPQHTEQYALLPWTKAIDRQIKIQRLNHLCWNMGGSGWAHLSEQELDEVLALASAAFTQWVDYSKEHLRVIVGTLGAVLSVYELAVLSVGAWRYEVRVMNKAQSSGALHIYAAGGSLTEQLFRLPVVERLFSSLEECSHLLAEIGDPFPAIPPDATWSSTRYL
jgi:hypothetical protein